MKELMWMFDVHYIIWNIVVHSYAQLFVTLCVFSKIVPSYVIKRPHKFLCMVRTLHETGSGT